MASRLAVVLEQWTLLRVVGPSDVIRSQESGSLPRTASKKPDEHLRTLAHAICTDAAVDAVLLGGSGGYSDSSERLGLEKPGIQAAVFVFGRSASQVIVKG